MLAITDFRESQQSTDLLSRIMGHEIPSVKLTLAGESTAERKPTDCQNSTPHKWRAA